MIVLSNPLAKLKTDVPIVTGSGLFTTRWPQLDLTNGNGPCVFVQGPSGFSLYIVQKARPITNKAGLWRSCLLTIEDEETGSKVTLNFVVRYRTPEPDNMVTSLEVRRRPGWLWLAGEDGEITHSVDLPDGCTVYLVPLRPNTVQLNEFPTEQRSWWGFLVTE